MRLQGGRVGGAHDMHVQHGVFHVCLGDGVIGISSVPCICRSGAPSINYAGRLGDLKENIIEHPLLSDQFITSGKNSFCTTFINSNVGIGAVHRYQIQTVIKTGDKDLSAGSCIGTIVGLVIGQAVEDLCLCGCHSIGSGERTTALFCAQSHGLEAGPVVIRNIAC